MLLIIFVQYYVNHNVKHKTITICYLQRLRKS